MTTDKSPLEQSHSLTVHFRLATKCQQLTIHISPSALLGDSASSKVTLLGPKDTSRLSLGFPGLPLHTDTFEFQESKASIESGFLLDVGVKAWRVMNSYNKHLFFCFCMFT